MDLHIFDSNVLLGQRMADRNFVFETPEELLGEMDRYNISQCLVHHIIAKKNNPIKGNELLVQTIQPHANRLIPCWVILPHYTGESEPPTILIEKMKAQYVHSVRIFPNSFNVELHLWLWKELLEELAQHRIPLFLDFETKNWSTPWNWEQIHELVRTFPELPVVLVRAGALANRYLYYFLDRFPNLYVEISYYQNNNVIVDVTRRFGAEKLIYGSGMPVYDPRFALSAIEYADLTSEDKAKVVGGNLRKLIKGVRW